MALDKPLEQITELDLAQLKDTGTAEGRTLDYKLQVHADAVDFRADVCALANTSGGHLILGVEEQGGTPVGIPGLSDPNPDAVKLRLEQILGSNIEPRLPNVGLRDVRLSNGRWCLVIRVPQSWAQPHAVVKDQSRKFWARHSSGNFVMDVGQLRTAFTLSANVEERIRDFRIQRLNHLQASEEGSARVVFHLIPVSAFTTSSRFDLSIIRSNGNYYQDLLRWGYNARHTLDGLIYCHAPSANQIPPGNFVLFFKNGAVEAVETHETQTGGERHPYFAGFAYDRILVENLRRLIGLQRALGVEPPIFVMLTIVGVSGWSIWVDAFRYAVDTAHPFDRDLLPLTAIMVDDLGTPPAVVMKDILDELWQASGWPRSFSYDDNGNWAPREQ